MSHEKEIKTIKYENDQRDETERIQLSEGRRWVMKRLIR